MESAEEELHMANYQLNEERKVAKRNCVMLDGLNSNINYQTKTHNWFPCKSCGECLIKSKSIRVIQDHDTGKPEIQVHCQKCKVTGMSICGVCGTEYQWDEGDFDVGISGYEYCPKCES